MLSVLLLKYFKPSTLIHAVPKDGLLNHNLEAVHFLCSLSWKPINFLNFVYMLKNYIDLIPM